MQQINSRIGQDTFRKIIATPELGILFPLLLLIVVIGSINPVFFSWINLSSVMRSTAYYGIISIGVSMVIMIGSIDISVGSVAALGACSSILLTHAGVPLGPAIILALLITGFVGFFNGFMVARVGMNGFIITIAMMFVARGTSFVITKGNPVYPVPEALHSFGNASPLGVSWGFVIFIILVIFFQFILKKTSFGRMIYSVGDNDEVAAMAGINIVAVKISTFIITGVLAGFSGIMLAGQINQAMPQIGLGWELQIVAGTAIGGISLLGGFGSMISTFLGMMTLAVLTNGLVLIGMDYQVQYFTNGCVIIIAVLLDIYRRNKLLKLK